MSYIGAEPAEKYISLETQNFTVSATTSYTLANSVTNENEIALFINNVRQQPGSSYAYTASGTTLTLSSATAGTDTMYCVYLGKSVGTINPPDGSVNDAKITAMSASKLTGTIADARFPATLPAVSGANLTNLPSEITKSTSEPTATTNPSGGVGTVYLRTTTGEMYCCTDATTNANVWTNIGDGTGNQPYTATVATGGSITTDGNFKVHTFTASGTFQVTTLGDATTVEYLVVAGGGGGGYDMGGGGGAGGYRAATGFSVSATSYTVTVGAGGAGSSSGSSTGGSGGDSVFSTITSLGGGGGGSRSSAKNGASGGSGGGGSNDTSTGGAGTSGQGYAGGSHTTSGDRGAGGGGAGYVGVTVNASGAGNGGDGLQNDITGTNTYYAGGGGGAGTTQPTSAGAGGQGGGGAGNANSSSGAGTAGTANTGGGGGGGTHSAGNGGAGGSGIVIIRYQFQA